MTYSEHILKCNECSNDPLNHRCEVGETLLHGTRVIETEKSIEVVPTFSVTFAQWLPCTFCDIEDATDTVDIRGCRTPICEACREDRADRVDEGNEYDEHAEWSRDYEADGRAAVRGQL